MKLYYKAVDPQGRMVEGLIEANDPSEAAAYLKRKNFTPIAVSKKEKNELPFSSMFKKTSSKDLVLFTRELSSMLASGLTLSRSLEILKNQMNNASMVEIIEGIITDIQEGASFSAAISHYPQLFTPVYVSLVRVSESSGLLDKALLRLAENLEKEEKLKSTIRSALTYPGIVIFFMILVMIVMMVFVIPQLSKLYESLDVSLPLPTQIIIGISNGFTTFWPLILGVMFLFLFFLRRWGKTAEGKRIIDSLILKLPIFGNLIKKGILTELTRTLGLLIGNGSLVVESLEQTAEISGNIHFRNAVLDVARKVEKGVTVGDALLLYDLFPPVLVQLVKVGEQTGKLDETLLKASEYFEREVNESVKTLTTAMEPFIMVVMGIGVAFLIIAVISPLYKLTSSIQ